MKILLVCKSLPPSAIGGIQTHTWKLSEHLLGLGHEVSILSAGSWRRSVRVQTIEGRQVIEIPYFPGRKLPFLSAFTEEWAFNWAASRWLERQAAQFDVVHVQGRSGFAFAGKQGQTPLVATFHGLARVENERSGRHRNKSLGTWLHEKWAAYHEKNTLRRADACIAVSREMLAEMEEVWPQIAPKTTLLPNGVDLPKRMLPVPANARQLLFVGRIDRIKGVFPLVEAMKQVHPDVHLRLVGDGPDRPALEKAIRQAGLTSRIECCGAQTQAVVFAEIQASFALVLPSYHETQGIVLLEANACARPVIASDIPGIREVVRQGETGSLVPAGDPQALAGAINWLFEHPASITQWGQAGQAQVAQKFSWAKIALETERLYGQMLASKNHSKHPSAKTDFPPHPIESICPKYV